MDLLTSDIRKLYPRYLAASFGSALIVSIYSLVDCAMVGQYEGPDGVAALATVAPVWNILYSCGLLFGIGGSVLMSAAKGAGNTRQAYNYYTLSCLGMTAAALLTWGLVLFAPVPMLTLFGADSRLLPLALEYLHYVRFAAPLFVLGQFLSAMLRNDGAPALATAATLAGGIFNVFGDYFFVFVMDMGIRGAGLATALGQVLSVLLQCSHFFSRRCSLKIVIPVKPCTGTGLIAATGFSSFFIDIAMGILSVMFNNQIMGLAGSDALAVYGVIVNVSTFVQACAYGVGQAAQPIISTNYGAGKMERVHLAFRLGLGTALMLGGGFTLLTMAFPLPLTHLFMDATPAVLAIAAPILRRYFLSFLLLPFNIYAIYYFQAVLRPKASFLMSVLRGLAISGLLIHLLPAFLGGNALWFAMPLTELLVTILSILLIKHSPQRSASHRPEGA